MTRGDQLFSQTRTPKRPKSDLETDQDQETRIVHEESNERSSDGGLSEVQEVPRAIAHKMSTSAGYGPQQNDREKNQDHKNKGMHSSSKGMNEKNIGDKGGGDKGGGGKGGGGKGGGGKGGSGKSGVKSEEKSEYKSRSGSKRMAEEPRQKYSSAEWKVERTDRKKLIPTEKMSARGMSAIREINHKESSDNNKDKDNSRAKSGTEKNSQTSGTRKKNPPTKT